jgi:hypothetical protein
VPATPAWLPGCALAGAGCSPFAAPRHSPARLQDEVLGAREGRVAVRVRRSPVGAHAGDLQVRQKQGPGRSRGRSAAGCLALPLALLPLAPGRTSSTYSALHASDASG